MDTQSTDAPISPLRQRMQHDMLMRDLGSHTQQDYVRHVRRFAAFVGPAPLPFSAKRPAAGALRVT